MLQLDRAVVVWAKGDLAITAREVQARRQVLRGDDDHDADEESHSCAHFWV